MGKISNIMAWGIYTALLAVLIPHTAYVFGLFESSDGLEIMGISIIAWLAALVFEGSILLLTHRLSHRWGQVGRLRGRRRFKFMYFNEYAFGLLIAVAVSALANVTHNKTFATEPYNNWLYLMAFGGILPIASLFFARVLSNQVEIITDDLTLEDFEKQKSNLATLRKRVKELASERDKLARERDKLARERDMLTTNRVDLQKFNDKAQAALLYVQGEYRTLEDAAKAAGVSASTISRLANSLNGVEK